MHLHLKSCFQRKDQRVQVTECAINAAAGNLFPAQLCVHVESDKNESLRMQQNI
jgi:hypothetical protein